MPIDATTDTLPPLCESDFTKVAICHYDKGADEYENLCVAPSVAPDYLDNYPKDFCGSCDQLSFEEKAAELDILNMVMSTEFNDLSTLLKDDGTAVDHLVRFTSAVRNELPVEFKDIISDADIIRPLLHHNSDVDLVPSSERSLIELNDDCIEMFTEFVSKLLGVVLAAVPVIFPTLGKKQQRNWSSQVTRWQIF